MSKTEKYSRIIQLVMAILIIFCSVGLIIAEPWIYYEAGLEGGVGYFSDSTVLFIPFLWLAIFFLLLFQLPLLIVVVGINGFKYLGRSLLVVGICVLVFCACWYFRILKFPSISCFTEGFRTKVQHEINIDEIQKWLQNIERPKEQLIYMFSPYGPDDKDPEGRYTKTLDSSNWPVTMRSLRPDTVIISPYGDDEVNIRIEWGGTFATWGLTIGPTDMETPKSDMVRHGEYRLNLAPGAYVWHELR